MFHLAPLYAWGGRRDFSICSIQLPVKELREKYEIKIKGIEKHPRCSESLKEIQRNKEKERIKYYI